MNILFKQLCTVALFGAFSVNAFANEDGAFLDAAYKDLVHPIVDTAPHGRDGRSEERKSNTLALVEKQSPVRSQGSRGTCSIFSATAMLESMLVLKKDFSTSVDLSEEWLEYLAMQGRDDDGSYSSKNFSLIKRYGMPTEVTYPYIGQTWEELIEGTLSEERCGHLEDPELTSCLLGHRDHALLSVSDTKLTDPTSKYFDPEFQAARSEAAEFRKDYLGNVSSNYYVYYTRQIKKLLRQGTPLTMGITFYYGAWNHRKATEFEIGRDPSNWSKGIVGYPEEGSMDYIVSPENPAGHSVLIVGYDDDKVVETKVKMEDGKFKTFKYKGVYYFKNSWGTGSFGTETKIDGDTLPGYGIITQKYAHEYGSFYQLPLK